MKRASLILVAFFATFCMSFAGEPDLEPHFDKLSNAYFDLNAQYPTVYTCELEVPEMVAAMDVRGRRAWGSGHILVSKTLNDVQLTAEDINDERAKGLFNLALVGLKLRLAVELVGLQTRMPPALAATARFVKKTAPDKFEAVEERRKGLLRFGIKAKSPKEMLQEITFVVDKDYQVKEYRLIKADGTDIHAKLENKRENFTDGKWLVTQMQAKIMEKNGMLSFAKVDLQYHTITFERKKYVTYKKIAFQTKDKKGLYIKNKPKDINPISFRLTKYKIKAGPVKKTTEEPQPTRTDPYAGIWVP